MITEKQKKAVDLVFKCYKTREIAAELGVHRTTLWRWFQKPEMQEYYEKRFIYRIRRCIKATTKTLREQLDSNNKWEANKAACALMDMAMIADLFSDR